MAVQFSNPRLQSGEELEEIGFIECATLMETEQRIGKHNARSVEFLFCSAGKARKDKRLPPFMKTVASIKGKTACEVFAGDPYCPNSILLS